MVTKRRGKKGLKQQQIVNTSKPHTHDSESVRKRRKGARRESAKGERIDR